jgi:hypothetical protein
MDNEEAVGIVFPLHASQARIVLAPIFLLPRGVEVIALRNGGARVRGELAKFRRSEIDVVGVHTRCCKIHGWADHTWIIRGLFAVGDNDETSSQSEMRAIGRITTISISVAPSRIRNPRTAVHYSRLLKPNV